MKYLFFSLFLFIIKLSSAQSYMTGFENMGVIGWYQINDWDTINRSSNQLSITRGWQGSIYSQYSPLPTALEQNHFIVADYNAVNYLGTISAWLLTPNRYYSNGDKFSFYSRTAANGQYPDRMEVRLSKNGSSKNVGTTPTSVGDFTTTLNVINSSLTAYGYPSSWTKYSITLSGLPASGISGRIAFRYYVTNSGSMGTNGDGVCIDSVLYRKNISTSLNNVRNDNHFKIFPNPANDLMKIYFSTPQENRRIIIQDIVGNVLFETQTSLIETEFNVSALSKGFYLISIIEEDKVFTEQVIID